MVLCPDGTDGVYSSDKRACGPGAWLGDRVAVGLTAGRVALLQPVAPSADDC